MAAKNAKPANSSDSENEWTFIDSYDGTIETKKDCVTYRKPTYSEILKGVTEEELAEVESEPEFEVLTSFQFRSKGESFGIGSSAPRNPKNSLLTEVASKTEASNDQSDGSSSDDGIMIISGHYEAEKPVVNKSNKNDIAVIDSDKCEADNDTVLHPARGSDSSATNDDIVVVDEGCMYDDAFNDDDEMIDLGDSEDKSNGAEENDYDNGDDGDYDDDVDSKTYKVGEVNTYFMNSSLNQIFFGDETAKPIVDGPLETPLMDTSLNQIFIDDPDEPTTKSDVQPVSCTNAKKRYLSIDPLDQSRDLAWDSLTFDLMNVQPIVMVSTTSLNDSQSILFQDSDESDCDLSSDNSFVPISKSDTHSSFDNLSDLSDNYCDFDETPMIPEWFYDPNFKIIGLHDSQDNKSFKDIQDEQPYDPLIPAWLLDPEHDVYDFDQSFDDCNYSEYSDSESEYTDYSDSDEDSVVAIPDWLFSSKEKRHHKDDDDGFLFSQLFVDVPTFVILLFLTTALGFSIGHGLTVYLSGQQRNTKLEGTHSQDNAYPSLSEQRLLTAEEIAKIDLIKLEDEIFRYKESELLSTHLRQDLKHLHQKLQKKHNRLVHSYKTNEERLQITKSMSWFWRNKYDQEKRRNQNSTAVTYLQRQLERVGALYEKEKKIANRWRRWRKARFPVGRKQNDSSEQLQNGSLKDVSNLKASLASKYWVKAILSSRGIDWEGFRKRWTEDFKNLKKESCVVNKSIIPKDIFGLRRNNKRCKKSQSQGIQNVTIKENSKILSKLDERRSKVVNRERNVQTRVLSPKPSFPVGPSKIIWSGMLETKMKRRKGETARRRNETIRKERLKKRAQRVKALEVEHQIIELKNVLAELRRERRKAEKEKFQLEASWRKLKRQRNKFEKEKLKKKGDKKKVKKLKTKLKRAKTKLKTWKNVAFVFQKRVAALKHEIQKNSRAKKRVNDIMKIKRDLKIEKRKLKNQRQELKTLKTQLRREHRNYAREGWKLKKKRKQLEQKQAPLNYSMEPPKKYPKQTQSKNKNRRARKTNPQASSKTQRRRKNNKKDRWKKQKRYWENLENAVREWTQNLNRTVKEKAGGKIKKVWKKLKEKFGNLMDFGWTKTKKAKPPYKATKKGKKKGKDSKPSLVYQKVLAEQLKFEKQKRKELDNSRKLLKPKSPIKNKKNKRKKEKDPYKDIKQRRRKQRRKFQRELERLQQWALQMDEKKLEHDRIYKDERKAKTQSAKVRLKSKCNKKGKGNEESEETSSSHRDLDSESVDDSSNLTNTLMLLSQPQFTEYQYNNPEKLYFDSKEPSQNTERIVREISMAQERETKRQPNTELSIPMDYDNYLGSTKSTEPEAQIPYQGNEDQMSKKPTPPLPDSTLYDKLPVLNMLGAEKGGSIGLPIAPPSLDPIGSHVSVENRNDLWTKTWFMRKTPQAWTPPPPGPLKSKDSLFSQRSGDNTEHHMPPGPLNIEQFQKKDGIWIFKRASDRAKQREMQGTEDKENTNEQNSFKTQFINSDEKFVKKNGIWVFARASDRAEQRLLYEPLNKQNTRDQPSSQSSQSKKTYKRRPKTRNKDGNWIFERAKDRDEQRLNRDPWFVRRAEGREIDREEQRNSWFLERGFDRELLRLEDAHDGDYDDDEDDEYHYDIDFGNYDDIDDDISAP